jgi:hypothetical protein
MKRLSAIVLLVAACVPAGAQRLANHQMVFDPNGILQPWSSWRDILAREVEWYLKSPVEHGYPRFVTMTFMDGDYRPIEKRPPLSPLHRTAWESFLT